MTDLQKKVSSLCSDSMSPARRPDMLPLNYEGKNLLAVKIYEIAQNKKTCYYIPKGLNKGAYTRVGDRDEPMTDYEIYTYEAFRKHLHDDERAVERAKMSLLDQDKIQNYLKRIRKKKGD